LRGWSKWMPWKPHTSRLPCQRPSVRKRGPDILKTTLLDLLVNGEPFRLAAGGTVLDLLAGLGRDPRTVAVERNGDLVRRADFAATRLAAGDRIEVVHFVQGG
jgi:sulfur carrier protein